MSRYAPPQVLRSRPHCDVYGWTEVSLSAGTVVALLRLPSAFRVKIMSALPNEESSRIDLACSRVVPYVPEKVPGVCLFSFQCPCEGSLSALVLSVFTAVFAALLPCCDRIIGNPIRPVVTVSVTPETLKFQCVQSARFLQTLIFRSKK